MLNPYSAEERLQTMLSCCYAAVKGNFPHLSVANIINPPRDWMDAILARQIAIHLLHVQFDVPRRRITDLVDRGRTAVSTAVYTIDTRREDLVFERAYKRMTARALDLFGRELDRAAA